MNVLTCDMHQKDACERRARDHDINLFSLIFSFQDLFEKSLF